MNKKTISIIGIVIFLIAGGVIGKMTYDRIYKSEVNKTVKEAGFNPDDYDLGGLSPREIREKIARQEIEKVLSEMGISINDVDLSGIDFSTLTNKEIYDIVYQRVADQTLKKMQPKAKSSQTPVLVDKNVCPKTEQPRQFQSEPYYSGPLFDAHIHVPVSSSIVSATAEQLGFENMPVFDSALSTDYLACLFTSEGIRGIFGFFLTTKFSLDQEVQSAKKFEQVYSGVVPFFMPGPFDNLRLSVESVTKTLNVDLGLFDGIGELKIFDSSSLDNSHFSELYTIASKNNMVVMIHPFRNDKAIIEKIVTRYPNIKFLLHGNEDGGWIMDVIKNHSNVYYSLDGNIIYLYGWKQEHYTGKGPTKEEYLAYVKNNFDSIIAKEIATWKPHIEAYPDRFMWGTDRWYSWHFNSDVGAVVTEMGRSFIGKLDSAVREAFAYKNAEKLFSQ